MNYTYFKLRAQPATLVITGFSNSITFTETHVNSDYTSGSVAPYQQTLTFSVPTTLGFPTANTPSFNDPSVTLTFSGTVSTNTNLKVTIGGSLLVNATASAGPTLSNYLTAIANASPYGVYTATTTGTNLVFTPLNTGNLYNNTSFTAVASPGASSFTMSGLPATFSGGITNYSVLINYGALGYSDAFIFSN
jgi:phage tail sheath gpL-like